MIGTTFIDLTLFLYFPEIHVVRLCVIILTSSVQDYVSVCCAAALHICRCTILLTLCSQVPSTKSSSVASLQGIDESNTWIFQRYCTCSRTGCYHIPRLVGLEDGTVLVKSYGSQQHLTPYFRPLPQFKQYQHFSFDALEPGVVVAKERSDSVGTRFQLLRNADILPPIDGLPVQAPPALDTTRQTYVFEKIREFCDEEAMDITCPAPKSRAGQKQVLRI